MAESEEENMKYYVKLFSLMNGPATDTLQLYVEMKVLDKLPLQSFLEKNKHILFHELHPSIPCCQCPTVDMRFIKKSLLSQVQFELLFQTDTYNKVQSHTKSRYSRKSQLCLCGVIPNRLTTVDLMDISLLSAVIKSCYTPMTYAESQWIRDISETRNTLAHCLTITKSKFDDLFPKTEQSVLNLAGVLGNVIQKMVKIQISKSEIMEKNSIDRMIHSFQKLLQEQTNAFEPSARRRRNFEENTTAIKTKDLSNAQVALSQEDDNVCHVEWSLASTKKWNVDKVKKTLDSFSIISRPWFPLEFVYKVSTVKQTSTPVHSLQSQKQQLTVNTHLKDFDDVCDLIVETKIIEKVGLGISKEKTDVFVDRLFKVPISFGLDLIIDRRLEEEYMKLIQTKTRDNDVVDKGTYCYMQEFLHICELRKKYSSTKLPSDFLTEAILKGKDIRLRWLLSNFDFENILGKEFKKALEVNNTRMAKTLAWKITNTFFVKYRNILNLVKLRIWPGFRCSCNSKDVPLICSNQFKIIIESVNSVNHIPVEFEGFQVRQLPYEKESKEAKIVTNSLSKYWKSEACCDNILIPGKEAESLFDNHSNLSLICSSIMKSAGMPNNQRIESVPCIQLHCTVKGVIPVGERHFPSFICQYPTDVLEGCPLLATEIKIGEIVGTLDPLTGNLKSQGTLGGFINHYGFPCFLTCAHVVCDLKNLIGRISNDIDNEGIAVFKGSPPPVNTPVQCGRVMRRVFEHSDKDKTSIDAALVNIIPGVSVDPKESIHGMFGFATSMNNLGILSMDLNEICIDIANICNSKVDLLCPGGFLKIRDKVKITPPEDHVEVQFPPDGGSAQHGYAQPLMIATTAHMQLNATNLAGQRVFRMYNQLLLNIPLNLGDSGTCIYVIDNEQRKGCLGMAIAFLSSGQCIITPLKEILKKFKH